MGIAIESRMPIMMMTIIISSNVNPRLHPLFSFLTILPVLILRAVQSLALRFGVNIEDALPAPGIRIRIVLHRTQPPLGRARHGIDGNLAKEADFLSRHFF